MTCVEPTKAQFFALNEQSTWAGGTASGVEIDEKGIRLAQHLEYAITKTIAEQELGANVKVVDFAIGACNLLYVLTEIHQKKTICTYDLSQDLFEQLDEIELEPSFDANSIAFAAGMLYYFGDDRGKQRVIALAWPANRIEWCYPRRDATDPIGFTPIDLAADSKGNLFTLVRAWNGFEIASFNARGEKQSTPLSKITPSAIAISPDGDVGSVLHEEAKGLLTFTVSATGELAYGNVINLERLIYPAGGDRLLPDFRPTGLAVDGKGRLYIGESREAPAKGDEDDRFLHKFDAAGNHLTPVAGFRGSAKLIAVDRTGKIVLLEQLTEQQKIIVLKPKEPKESKTKSSSVARGDYLSRAFDSTTPGTEWHKLALEATIPANTQLLVAHYVADNRMSVEEISKLLDWGIRSDLSPCSTWSEPIEFSPVTLKEHDETSKLTALLRETDKCPARGRYLWLKLTLIGGEQGTPEVKSVRIYFPRLSYLRYLPAVYQQDKRGRDFIERFLSLFETFFADIEQRIDHITRHFDADGVADEFLRWLAGWLAIAADEDWTSEQLRSLMRQAPTLFRRRGTRAGIEEMVKVFTDDYPFILEQFQIPLPSAETEEDYQEQLNHLKQLYRSYPDPYYFYVFLKPNQAQRETERTVVRRLIEAEKPAHTRACILHLEPWIYLDEHTYLGVNTILSEPPARLGMGAPLGATRLIAPINRQRQDLSACDE